MKKTAHTCNCLGVEIVATNLKSAIHTLSKHFDEWRGNYITFVNVHALVMAVECETYMDAQREAVCNFADGKPVSALQKKKSYIQAGRVAGPDFLTGMLDISKDCGVRHFFYGSSMENLEKMVANIKEMYPTLEVAGYHAPQFVEEINYDTFEEVFAKDLALINETNPDFIWVGLGAPKQEQWMYYAKGRTDGIMLGVGAAFDFLSGASVRAPKLLQLVGLEWFYRLCKDPKRLWKRYLVTNAKFIWYCLKDR